MVLIGGFSCPQCQRWFKSSMARNNHLGKAHGIPSNKIVTSVHIDIDLIEWIDTMFSNRSEAINTAVKAMKEARA